MVNQDKEIEARDKDAENFEEWYVSTKGHYHDFVEKKTILNHLNLEENDVILDAGCGTGRITRLLAKNCKKIYALDFSEKSIEILNKKIQKENIGNIETYVCDITKKLPIIEKVDKILVTEVLQHLPTNKDRQIGLKNLFNQLKTGGTCLSISYNWNFFNKRNLMKEGKFPSGIYYFRFSKDEIERLYTDCHFIDMKVSGCINFKLSYLLTKYNFPKFICSNLAQIDVNLSRTGFSSSLGEYILCKGFKEEDE